MEPHRTWVGSTRLGAGLLVVPLTLVLSGCPCPLPPPAAFDQIEQKVKADAVDSFALGELENLPTWHELHLFAPYTSTPDIEARLGFPWPDADHFDLDQRDDIYLAVFVDKGHAEGDRVVAVGEWPRSPFTLGDTLLATPLTPESIVLIDRTGDVAALLLATSPPSELDPGFETNEEPASSEPATTESPKDLG